MSKLVINLRLDNITISHKNSIFFDIPILNNVTVSPMNRFVVDFKCFSLSEFIFC